MEQVLLYAHLEVERGGDVSPGAFYGGWSVRSVGVKELWALKWHKTYVTSGPWTAAGGVIASDWPLWMRKYKDY